MHYILLAFRLPPISMLLSVNPHSDCPSSRRLIAMPFIYCCVLLIFESLKTKRTTEQNNKLTKKEKKAASK